MLSQDAARPQMVRRGSSGRDRVPTLVVVHPQLQAIAETHLGVFTAKDALRVGLTVGDIRAELRGRRWVRLRKGVYTTRDGVAAADQRGRHLLACVAVLLSLDAGPALSHASAARLHGSSCRRRQAATSA